MATEPSVAFFAWMVFTNGRCIDSVPNSLGVVDDNRPQAIDGDVLDRELVHGGAVIPARRNRQIAGVLFGIAAPKQRASDQVPPGSTRPPAPNMKEGVFDGAILEE
jgi:hypothetical protein